MIMVRFGRLHGDKLAPKLYATVILRRSRLKFQNYCICSTGGPFHMFEMLIKSEETVWIIPRYMTSKMECLSLARKSGSRTPEEAPRHTKTPHNPPICRQDGRQTTPRWPRDAPRWPQDAPKRAQGAAQTLQGAPKRSLKASKTRPAPLRTSIWQHFGDDFG